jgi:hypothetical protein
MRNKAKTTETVGLPLESLIDSSQGQSAPAKALVTTSQAARIAGVSASTIVRNRDELGAVAGPKGVYLFDERTVRERITTIRRRHGMATLGPTTGDVASAVFAALRDGMHARDIVIEQRVAPDVVIELKKTYDDLNEQTRGARVACRCGGGRFASSCFDCALVVDGAQVERRTSPQGSEEVRAVGMIVWGRLPTRRPDAWSALVNVELRSEWVAADSVDGRDLIEAQHPARALREADGEER